jgi:endonuclease/exonuclease/phosphatase family metal-dependent hydrolase
MAPSGAARDASTERANMVPSSHTAESHDLIRVQGARENNLKDVSVEIPKRRLTVFTGVSGSGKSSLVFGTIAAESQRLINETYSAFVQELVGHTVLVVSFALWSLGRLTGFFTDPRLSPEEIHRIVGSPSAVAAPAAIPDRLDVVSWNIERGVRFEGVLDTLRKLNADVLLLQEVDRFCDRSGGRDVAGDLAAALGMSWVAAGEYHEIGEGTKGRVGLHGQAILSRYPITDAGVLVFADQARLRWRLNPFQPRRGGRMALKARTGGMLVYSAHLESGGNDELRRHQLDELVRDQQREARPDERIVIAGDFNNPPLARSPMFRTIRAERFVDSHGGTPRLTSINRAHPIDWIFVKNLALLESDVYAVKGVSDHFPVFASVTNVRVAADLDR